jgi:hypothetical protein
MVTSVTTARPRTGRATSRAGLVGLVALVGLVLASLGCGAGTSSVSNVCPSFPSTGGDPLGDPAAMMTTWTVSDSCQVPYPRTATADWCSQLVYGDGVVKDGLFLGQQFIPISTMNGESTVTYTADANCPNHDCGTYSAMLVFSGPTTTNFPLGCLRQHTPNPTCAPTAGALAGSDLQTQIQMLAENVLPMIVGLTCVDDGNDGCNCSYTVTTKTIAPDVGSWRVEADTHLLIHYPSLPALAVAYPADVEIDGATMMLHGHAGIPLLAHDPLRNLTLVRTP